MQSSAKMDRILGIEGKTICRGQTLTIIELISEKGTEVKAFNRMIQAKQLLLPHCLYVCLTKRASQFRIYGLSHQIALPDGWWVTLSVRCGFGQKLHRWHRWGPCSHMRRSVATVKIIPWLMHCCSKNDGISSPYWVSDAPLRRRAMSWNGAPRLFIRFRWRGLDAMWAVM